MPIYEFICKKCGGEFETIVSGTQKVECEYCGSKNIEKQFSVFAAQSGASADLPACAHGGCSGFSSGACGSGMCGGH